MNKKEKNKQFRLRITEDLHKRMKMYVTRNSMSMQGWIEDLLEEELQKKGELPSIKMPWID